MKILLISILGVLLGGCGVFPNGEMYGAGKLDILALGEVYSACENYWYQIGPLAPNQIFDMASNQAWALQLNQSGSAEVYLVDSYYNACIITYNPNTFVFTVIDSKVCVNNANMVLGDYNFAYIKQAAGSSPPPGSTNPVTYLNELNVKCESVTYSLNALQGNVTLSNNPLPFPLSPAFPSN